MRFCNHINANHIFTSKLTENKKVENKFKQKSSQTKGKELTINLVVATAMVFVCITYALTWKYINIWKSLLFSWSNRHSHLRKQLCEENSPVRFGIVQVWTQHGWNRNALISISRQTLSWPQPSRLVDFCCYFDGLFVDADTDTWPPARPLAHIHYEYEGKTSHTAQQHRNILIAQFNNVVC